MWMVAAALLSPAASQEPATASKPIIVHGQKTVCTSTKVTGSRIGRQKRCRTQAEAELETQIAREAARERSGTDRVIEAISCGPPSTRLCK